jgi:predicted Zn-dependent protease
LVACSTKEDYVARGDRFQTAGRPDDAAINYRKALQKDPAYGLAWYKLGLLQLSLKKPSDAYQSLSSANKYLSGNADVIVHLADLALGAYLTDPKRPGEFHSQVSRLADELVANDSNSFDGLRLQGTLAATDRHPDRAIELLRRADALKPMQPDVILPLAGALSEIGHGPDAEKLVESLIDRDKSIVRAYDFLFIRYSQTGRADEAARILTLKADNNPRSAQWVRDLAGYYSALG